MASNWDKDKPAGTTKIRLSDEQIRANYAALEDALARDHEFPGNEGSDAGEHKFVKFFAPIATPGNEPNKGFLYLKDVDAKVELHFLDEDGNEIQLSAVGAIYGSFPSGTKLYFYQDTAPSGWTIDAACVDALLAVKGGADAFDVVGGNQAGTWTQPNHEHVHKWYDYLGIGAAAKTYDVDGNAVNVVNSGQYTSNVMYLRSSGNAANMYSIQDAWTEKAGADGGDDTYRPLAQVGIIATKD